MADARFEGFVDTEAKFFKQLAKNNRRDWFQAHRNEYDEGWASPMSALLGEVRAKVDRHFPHCDLAEPKTFRIFRDVRFSKDKSPYKTHIGGLLSVAGGRGAVETPAALYLHVGHDELFACSGAYVMNGPQLDRYRKALVDAKRGGELAKKIAGLKKKGYSFGSHEMLQRVPRGFDPEHPRAELLKRKGLIVTFPALPKKLLTSRKLVDWLASHVKASAPIVEWLVFAMA